MNREDSNLQPADFSRCVAVLILKAFSCVFYAGLSRCLGGFVLRLFSAARRAWRVLPRDVSGSPIVPPEIDDPPRRRPREGEIPGELRAFGCRADLRFIVGSDYQFSSPMPRNLDGPEVGAGLIARDPERDLVAPAPCS